MKKKTPLLPMTIIIGLKEVVATSEEGDEKTHYCH
jgi:hypothetical protein